MKAIHIVAGLIALIAGAVALCAAKGSVLHRKSGIVFVVAMLTMSSTGAVMTLLLKRDLANVVAAALTFYLVATALLTVRTVSHARALAKGLAVMAFATTALAFALAFGDAASAPGSADRTSVGPLVVFGAVSLLGGVLDMRWLRAARVDAARRLSRHIWRMTLAMFIATASFFLGQAKVFPAVLREHTGWRAIPVLLVLATMIYWLVRVRIKGRDAVRRAPVSVSAVRDLPSTRGMP